MPGAVIARSAPRVRVQLRQARSGLEAHAAYVGLCETSERRSQRRRKVERTEVTTTTVVVASVFALAGLAIYMAPTEEDAGTSAAAGTTLVAIGGLIYGIPKLSESEQSVELEPATSYRRAEPAPCKLGPIAHERILVRSATATLQADTDASGRATFDGRLSPPVEVLVSGRAPDSIEWR